MNVTRLIERKRDGEVLAAEEWAGLVEAYAAGRVPDYQVAALLMAVYFRGLEDAELDAITDAMLASGDRLPHAGSRPRIDKHSTGGVGDKVSLVLAPLVAACGVAVPMMSGRGLGHTGGTLDKLEAIPGFRTGLSLAEADRILQRTGVVLIGQTEEIAPADRRMYALRDVTATVEIIPLIAASIVSKKIAESLDGLVLDVKRGTGAFLPGVEDGLTLARTMVRLGEARGCPTVALLTAMDRPLGWACGNALETEEAIATLRGEGPPDLVSVTLALGAEMLLLAQVATSREEAVATLQQALDSGAAAETFRAVIEAQGGNPSVVDDPAVLSQAPVQRVVGADRDGRVAAVEPRVLGRAIVAMGGGRTRVDQEIDLSVGFVVTAKPGDTVREGDPLATVHAADEAGLELGCAALAEAIRVTDEAPAALPLISHRVSASGVEQYADPP